MLTETEKEAGCRATVIQSMARTLLTFFASCRPSTLGYTEKIWHEAGRVRSLSTFTKFSLTILNQYPKLVDVRVFRLGYMEYQIEMVLKCFKVHQQKNLPISCLHCGTGHNQYH
jgi:hypothetical protein